MQNFLSALRKCWEYCTYLATVVALYFVFEWFSDPLWQMGDHLAAVSRLKENTRAVFDTVFVIIMLLSIPIGMVYLFRSLLAGIKHKLQQASRLSLTSSGLTVFLILFQFALVSMRRVVCDATMEWLAQWAWLGLLLYLNIEFAETSSRDSANTGGYLIDNGLAFIGFCSFILIYLLNRLSAPWKLSAEELSILYQCAAFGLTDFLWGLLFSQRIAAAGKDRTTELARSPN